MTDDVSKATVLRCVWMGLVNEGVYHLECMCRFYLRHCALTWWRKKGLHL